MERFRCNTIVEKQFALPHTVSRKIFLLQDTPMADTSNVTDVEMGEILRIY